MPICSFDNSKISPGEPKSEPKYTYSEGLYDPQESMFSKHSQKSEDFQFFNFHEQANLF